MSNLDLGSPCVVAHQDGAALHVRIDRVDRRNAMTQDMYRAVKRAAIHADREPTVRAMVLTGTDDVFAVGGDMGGNAIDDPALQAEWDPTDHFPFRHLERCRKPIIAAVNGLCYAGGLDLAMYCDIVIASDQARFWAPELLRGAPDIWLATRLADIVGPSMAKYLLFAMPKFDAAEAKRIGLVHEVHPHEQFADAVAQTVAAVLRAAPASAALVKDELNKQLAVPDARIFQRTIMNPEMREGMTAFLEKREPDWDGLSQP